MLKKNETEGYDPSNQWAVDPSNQWAVDPDPDDDFIDILAVAQNITCEFADKADADCWLLQ